MANTEYLSFYLDDNFYGVELLAVKEITKILEFTEVFLADETVFGLVNLRGQVITVINLRSKLKMNVEKDYSSSLMIIIKTTEELQKNHSSIETTSDQVALLVDKIGDVFSVDEEHHFKPPANVNGSGSEYVSGIIEFNEKVLTVLSLTDLLNLEFQFEEK